MDLISFISTGFLLFSSFLFLRRRGKEEEARSLPPQLDSRCLPVLQISSAIIRRRIRVPRPRQPNIMRRLHMKRPITSQQSVHVRRDVVEVAEDGEAADVEVDGDVGGEDVVEEVEAALVERDGEGVEDLLDRDGFGGVLGRERGCEGRGELLGLGVGVGEG